MIWWVMGAVGVLLIVSNIGYSYYEAYKRREALKQKKQGAQAQT